MTDLTPRPVFGEVLAKANEVRLTVERRGGRWEVVDTETGLSVTTDKRHGRRYGALTYQEVVAQAQQICRENPGFVYEPPSAPQLSRG